MLARALDRIGLRARLAAARPHFPLRELFGFTVPLLTTDLVYAALGLTDALLLARYRGAAAVGGLRAVQPIAQLNQIVFSTFLVLFTPVIARHFARNETREIHHVYWQTARWIALVSLPVFILTVDLAGPVTTTLFGARYGSSATVLAILSIGYYAQAAFGFNGTTLMVYGRLRYIVSLNIAAVCVNVLLNLVLVPRYGAPGAAIGTTGTLIAHNLLKQIGLRVTTGIRLAGSGSTRFYATLLVGAGASLVAARTIAYPPAQVAVALAAVLVVVRVNRPALMVAETFPELARVPLVRSLLT
jgi:O-antigen/teichoic acid export membrane protein